MSWLARSIANSLKIDEDDRPTTSNDDNNNHPQSLKQPEFNVNEQGSDPQTLTGGVKGDLSEFTESLSRQIWGVASFLAPPPPPPPPPPLPLRHHSFTTAQPDRHRGNSGEEDRDLSNLICDDSRFGDEFGVSNSSTFPIDDQEEDVKGFVGVTDEVLAFAMNIAHHPETWLDFPLSEEEDSDDFEMSDSQWNHTTLVEDLVPRLAALRNELCPVHMSESYFWKVYFVLLHPRLNKDHARLLSTPQIVAARSMWMKELQIQTKLVPDLFDGNTLDTTHPDDNTPFESTTNYHTLSDNNEPVLTKQDGLTTVASDHRAISSFTLQPYEDFSEDEDNWVHENSELDGYDGPDISLGDDEDISFSDLEDDYYCTMPTTSKII